MEKNVKISIVIPFYLGMKNAQMFLDRCLASIRSQTFQDFEIIVSNKGKAAENTNKGVRDANGDIVKILCMDDYFTNKNALKEIVDNFKGDWLIHGVSDHQKPYYTGDIHLGNNKLGGLSCMVFKKSSFIPFDESLVWLFDCDWHKMMYNKYGEPTILNGNLVTIEEEGESQATFKISKEIKDKEEHLMRKKYV